MARHSGCQNCERTNREPAELLPPPSLQLYAPQQRRSGPEWFAGQCSADAGAVRVLAAGIVSVRRPPPPTLIHWARSGRGPPGSFPPSCPCKLLPTEGTRCARAPTRGPGCPNGRNLGPNGDAELYFKKAERQVERSSAINAIILRNGELMCTSE